MAKGYALLILSIVLEVFSTQMMKFSAGFTKIVPTIVCAAGMAACFYVFSKTLTILPLGVAYAMWAGLGLVLTASLSVVIWKEHIDLQMVIGFALIIIGCVLLNLRRG